MYDNQHRADSLAAHPAIFGLLKDGGTVRMAEQMTTLKYLPIQERTAPLMIAEGPTCHLRFLWEIKKSFSYVNKTALDGHILALSRNIVAGDTPPTIPINPHWLDLEDHPIPSPHKIATEVAKLQPVDNIIPKKATVSDQARIPLACIVPLAFIYPLLTAPYLSPAAAYILLSARATAW